MFKILLIVLLAGHVLPQDEVLDSLYGATGQNLLTICAEEAVNCEGALWKPRWVLTRSSCIYDLPFWQLSVIKSDKGCEDYLQGLGSYVAHLVYASFTHPDPELDITLLYLDGQFGQLEKLANESAAREILKEYEPWLQKTVHTYLYGNTRAKWMGEVASPMRMFLTAGVLPSAALIIFFLFMLFFTSPNKSTSAYEHRTYLIDKNASV